MIPATPASSGAAGAAAALATVAGRQLKDSFQLLFEHSTEPMVITDGLTGQILDANAGACALVGMSRARVLQRFVADFLPGGEEENRAGRAVRQITGSARGEGAILDADGQRIPISYWEVECLEDDGSLRVFIGFQDLRPTRRLAHAEATLEALFETSPDGNLVTGFDGRTKYANRAHLELWGLDESALQLPFAERWSATRTVLKDPKVLADLTSLARNPENGLLGTVVETIDGRYFQVRCNPVRDADGNAIALSFSTRDVTTERVAEAALSASEDRYRTLVSSLTVGVVLQDAQGRIVEANPATERILGLSRDQLLGLTSFDPRWRCFREDGSNLTVDEHPAVITRLTGKPCVDVLLGVEHVSGEQRWLRVTSSGLFDAGGLLSGVVVSFEDVTDRRNATEALLRVRTARALQSLAATVAHKVNNSLTSIVGNAYLASLPGDLPAETTQSLGEITRASADAASLVHDLLALSGSAEQLAEDTDISTEVSRAVARLARTSARVTIDLAPGLPHLRIEREGLRLALANLLENALEAGDHVGVSTRAVHEFRPEPGAEYSPAIPVPSRYLAITVADDGPGIPVGLAGRVFEPFPLAGFAGRGLGLAATAAAIGRQGGFVEMLSSPAGCRATVYLPMP